MKVQRHILRVLYAFMGLAVVFSVFGWLVLAAPFFSQPRRALVEKVLSEQIGQPLRIKDDVSVVLGPVSRVHVRGVEIPSETIPDVMLAELNRLNFELNLVALAGGTLSLDNLAVDGLQVSLVTLEDGTTSWAPVSRQVLGSGNAASGRSGAEMGDTPEPNGSKGILSFLRGKTAAFSTIGLSIENRDSGFSFLFDLASLILDQHENEQGASLTGRGSVNGQEFSIEGHYPSNAPFAVRTQFGSVIARFNGVTTPSDEGGGYDGRLELETDELGDLLEVLGLDRELEGQVMLSADIVEDRDRLSVKDFEALVQLEQGQTVSANGSVENLRAARGIDVSVLSRLYSESRPLPVAEGLSDLKLTGFDFQIAGDATALEFHDVFLRTNGFEHGLEKVGPASIGRIRRTAGGRLALEEMTLRAGPPDNPYLVADGEIMDLLRLKDLRLDGRLTTPADFFLSHLGKQVPDAFGKVEARFRISDSAGVVALTNLHARSLDTDIWSLDASLTVDDLMELGGLYFDMDLDVPDAARFLADLNLVPVALGTFGIDASVRRQGGAISTSLGLAAGGSRLDASLDATAPDGVPVVRGKIESDRLDLDDLTNLTATLGQLGTLSEPSKAADEPDLRPRARPKVSDEPEVPPMEPLKAADLLNLQNLLIATDLKVALDIRKITGQKGLSSISSDLVANKGRLSLGPLDVSYGSGNFNLDASVDVVNAPETLSLSGSATGWDLGQALKTAGLKYDAGGDLRGTFDLTGSTKGVRAFLNTMNGTATISMSGGFIRTSLLELAGLGVVPWLFSQEMRQGYTDVVCIMAPLGISSGKVSSKSVVAETKSVQLVASGMIDWKNDRISIHAEPRPVGKPMSRSAWPFDITGRLSAPQFDLEPAGSRTRLIDRAAASPANRQPCKPDIAQAPNDSSVNDARPSILPRQLIPPANETRPNFLPRLLSPPR